MNNIFSVTCNIIIISVLYNINNTLSITIILYIWIITSQSSSLPSLAWMFSLMTTLFSSTSCSTSCSTRARSEAGL